MSKMSYDLVKFTEKHKPFGWKDFFNDKNTKLLIENINNHLENEMFNILPPIDYIGNGPLPARWNSKWIIIF